MASYTRTIDPGLFPDMMSATSAVKAGVLPSQDIEDLISSGRVHARLPIGAEQIQPARLDLRVGELAHRVQASFLPGQYCTVHPPIKDLRRRRVDRSGSTVYQQCRIYPLPSRR